MIETMVSDGNYLVITVLNSTVSSPLVNVICLIVRTDIITIYDITIGYVSVFIG